MRLFYIIFTCFSLSAAAQLAPNLVDDQAWVPVPGLTDEFNSGTTYNPAMWTWNPAWTTVNGATCFQNDANNISVQSGYARLTLRQESCSCIDGYGVTQSKSFSSGGLFGLNEQQYGYFEVRYKISDIPTPPATLEGLAASAWLWRSWVPFNCVWSEIDLSETDAIDHRQTCNVIYDPEECDSVHLGAPLNVTIPIPSQENMRCATSPCVPVGDIFLSSGWHTYAAVWNPNGIAIYVDNMLMNRTILGCPGMEPLNWILGPSSGEYQFTAGITPNTQLPFYMDIDYVRVYELQTDCATTVNACSFNFATHDDLLKNSITIGGSGCSNTMPTSGSGSKVYLRAVNSVNINGEFTVPVGSELTIETLGACY